MKATGRVFGLRCGVLLGTYDPDTSSLKTLERSLFEDLTESLVRLPRSGMMQSGRIYEQATWVLRTEGRGSGLWPTPAAWDAVTRNVTDKAYVTKTGSVRNRYGKRSSNAGLQATVKMWPTPKRPSGGGQMQRNTPGGGIRKLEDAVSQDVGYPTSQLNAVFCEWLMGYDENWTAMGPTGRKPNDWAEEWPGVPRVMSGQKDRIARLRCLGNSIVPQIAEMLFRQIATGEKPE